MSGRTRAARRPEAQTSAQPACSIACRGLWLIDGYNVIRVSLSHHEPRPSEDARGTERTDKSDRAGSWWSAEGRMRLFDLVERHPELREPDTEVWLVFDGRHLAQPELAQSSSEARSELEDDRFHVVFAPSADEWIVHAVKSRTAVDEGDARITRVVTADRKLASRSRHHGAEVISNRRFLSSCGLPVGPQDPEAGSATAV